MDLNPSQQHGRTREQNKIDIEINMIWFTMNYIWVEINFAIKSAIW